MKILFFVLAVYCLGLVSTEDSLAMESEVNYHKVKRHHPEEQEVHYQPNPGKKYVHGKFERRRHPIHREREAREEEESWRPYYKPDVKGPVYEAPRGFEIEEKYYEDPKQRYYQPEQGNEVKQVQYVSVQTSGNEEGESLKGAPSQYTGLSSGSYLNHIKEQMSEGKLLGFSSFVEHFSENDDAEELKTAMKEGSLDDIKRLVPKSSVSFQMYHGDEEKVYKTEPVHEKKPESSWNEANEWHHPSPTPWIQPHTHVKTIPYKTFAIPERKKRMRKPQRLERHRPIYQYQESRDEIHGTAVPELEHAGAVSNEINDKENYPQIVPSLSFELPSQSFKKEVETEPPREQDRQESQTNYHSFTYDNEQGWKPANEKPTLELKTQNTPKPPETSKIYYEHFKNSKPSVYQETSKYSQLPKVGQVVVDQPAKHTTKFTKIPETYVKKPLRVKSTTQPTFKRPVTPSLASGEDFNQHFAQIPTATQATIRLVSPQPTRYWSKPDTTNHFAKFPPETSKRIPIPIKLEKIINKQAENHGQIERPSSSTKENGNIFLTKEFQSEISEYFKGGKSDFEWIPSSPVGYDSSAHGTNQVPQHAAPETPEPSPKPKKYRIYRSERNLPLKNVILLGPEAPQPPREFSVSASYKIDKNRKNDDQTR